jgi:predicted RNA-binding Zn ribbon-like protein
MASDRPEAFFIAGALGLDFLNSIATPVDVPVEWLSSGEDLLAWLGRAGLLAPGQAAAFHKSARRKDLDAVAAKARALREWFRGFVLAHMGKRLKPTAIEELKPLNAVLARDQEFGQIVAERGSARLRWSTQRRWQSPDALLLPIARMLADLVCNEDFAQIKGCEGPVCTLLYLDRTRSHARRWCSMAVCGNRSKQAAHRRKH